MGIETDEHRLLGQLERRYKRLGKIGQAHFVMLFEYLCLGINAGFVQRRITADYIPAEQG